MKLSQQGRPFAQSEKRLRACESAQIVI